MSAQSTEDLVRQLARDLVPVRPIPRLGVIGLLALGLGIASFAIDLLLGGQGFRPHGDRAWSEPAFLVPLVGLIMTAIGGIGAAIASAVPGRERSAHLGAGVMGLGLFVALAGGLWGWLRSGVPMAGEDVLACLWCMGRAAGIGLGSTLLAAGFIVYAAAQRLGGKAALALIGGVALGAAAVHVTCPSDSPLHHLVAHILAPVVAAGLLTLPLAAGLRRWSRRRQEPSGPAGTQ